MDDGKRTSFERRNPRGLVADTDSDDDSSIEIDIGEDTGLLNLDSQYEDELGYGMIVMLRGRTTGRRVKRELCCLTAYQVIVAVALYIIAYKVARTRYIVTFLEQRDSAALGWIEAVSQMCFVWAAVTVMVLRFWASLVTNRALLSTILKLYVLAFFIKFILVLVAIVTVCNVFNSGPRYGYGAGPDVNVMLKYYLLTVVFMIPYLIVVFLYGLNVSYLNEEVEMGGSIMEPSAVGATDMTGITLTECCTVVLAYPLAIIYQCMELGYAIYLMGSRGWKFFWRRYEENRQAGVVARAAAAAERAKKGRSFSRRLSRTFARLLSYIPGFRTKPDPFIAPLAQDLRNFKAGDRELAERLEQERFAEEAERRAQFEKQRREKESQLAAEARQFELEAAKAAARSKELQEEEDRIAASMFQPTLNSDKFKEMWASLAQAGSFQCKLKAMPSIKDFTSHLLKQGFHVVFAAGPGSSGDVEVGLCNIRVQGSEEKWFLARLLASASDGTGAFSAVMKAESPDIVPTFVKKFALAKILKIDTSKK